MDCSSFILNYIINYSEQQWNLRIVFQSVYVRPTRLELSAVYGSRSITTQTYRPTADRVPVSAAVIGLLLPRSLFPIYSNQ
jgi:hypothetical protein